MSNDPLKKKEPPTRFYWQNTAGGSMSNDPLWYCMVIGQVDSVELGVAGKANSFGPFGSKSWAANFAASIQFRHKGSRCHIFRVLSEGRNGTHGPQSKESE